MSNSSSKYEKYKTDSIYPHKHCPICNKQVPEEGSEFGEYCSAECAGYVKKKKKKKRKRFWIMGGGYVIIIVVLLLISVLAR